MYRRSYLYWFLALIMLFFGILNIVNFFQQGIGLYLLPVIVSMVVAGVFFLKGLLYDPYYTPPKTEITKQQALDEVNARVVQIKTRGMGP